MANFISENSGLGKMQAMQDALANSPKPPKVKLKLKIKIEKPQPKPNKKTNE